ncbi:HNH endonuclease [Treponema endosymbiont of Eucomonympha sp.]|uniref:HNH endonuclease n=1 Tax=Treponema endosymbiont of Eucomonympha sp. TaxID=1580831 RepID=UPI0034D23023
MCPGEIVHHKNRNKLDNSPGNLQVFPNQTEHDKYHKQTDLWFKLSRKSFRRIRRIRW